MKTDKKPPKAAKVTYYLISDTDILYKQIKYGKVELYYWWRDYKKEWTWMNGNLRNVPKREIKAEEVVLMIGQL